MHARDPCKLVLQTCGVVYVRQVYDAGDAPGGREAHQLCSLHMHESLIEIQTPTTVLVLRLLQVHDVGDAQGLHRFKCAHMPMRTQM
jgi:hypothetical protein